MAAPFFYYLSSFATLEVDDVETAADWYREALGFHTVSRAGDGNGSGLVHLSRGENQDLVLVQGRHVRPEHGPVLNFAVDSSLRELEERARAAGAPLVERSPRTDASPESLRVRDPQGYELRLFKRVVPKAPGP